MLQRHIQIQWRFMISDMLLENILSSVRRRTSGQGRRQRQCSGLLDRSMIDSS